MWERRSRGNEPAAPDSMYEHPAGSEWQQLGSANALQQAASSILGKAHAPMLAARRLRHYARLSSAGLVQHEQICDQCSTSLLVLTCFAAAQAPGLCCQIGLSAEQACRLPDRRSWRQAAALRRGVWLISASVRRAGAEGRQEQVAAILQYDVTRDCGTLLCAGTHVSALDCDAVLTIASALLHRL